MTLNRLRYCALALSLLVAASLTGCVYDKLPDCPDGVTGTDNGFALALTVSLDDLIGASTRDGSDLSSDDHVLGTELTRWENYVDPRRFKLIFFRVPDEEEGLTEQEKILNTIALFQVNANQCDLQELDYGNRHHWLIKIPLSYLEGEHGAEIEDAIRNHHFKIAVLVNSPDALPGPTGADEEINLNFNYNDKQNITRFAHYVYDAIYSQKRVNDENEIIIFDHLIDDDGPWANRMGVYTDWVDNTFAKVADAEKHIRYSTQMDKETCDVYYKSGAPTFYGESSTPFELHNLWKVWSFSLKYDEANTESKFSDCLNGWHDALAEKLGDTSDSGDAVPADYANMTQNETHNGLSFARGTNGSDSEKPSMAVRNGDLYGIALQRALATNKASDTFDGNYLSFTADADITLRVKVGSRINLDSPTTHHNVYFAVHAGNQAGSVKEDVTRRQGTVIKTSEDTYGFSPDYLINAPEGESGIVYSEPQTFEIPIEVTGKPIEVRIFCSVSNNDDRMVVYDVEFIKDTYIYNVDRKGILPGREHGIPMFGIQEFDPIGDVWTPGTLFNLSQNTGVAEQPYNYKPIYLLRALARIELNVLKSLGTKPSHVYMRSMNRTARSEPADFWTPTEVLWDGSAQHPEYTGEERPGIDVEYTNIRKYGPLFDPDYVEDDGSAYWKKTSWFYGCWTEWGWDWNGLISESDVPTTSESGETLPFPRIFNSRIDRSDYTRFIELEDDGSEYYRYVLYMPEKNIDDANQAGVLNERPKVHHIEIRFEGMADDTNLDDNGAYRIYFAPGGRAGEPLGRDEYDSKYEGTSSYQQMLETLNHLKDHYPVIRNHIYRFNLKGLNQSDTEVVVCSPAGRNIEVPEFN